MGSRTETNQYAFTDRDPLLENVEEEGDVSVSERLVSSNNHGNVCYQSTLIAHSGSHASGCREENKTNGIKDNEDNNITPTDVVTTPKHWLFGNVFPIEVVVFLYTLSLFTVLPVMQYYLIFRVWTANPTHTKAQVLDRVADYNIYFSLAINLTAVLPTIFYGVLSDRYGRKLVMIISLLGSLVKCVGLFLIVHFDAGLNFIYIPYFIEGLCGTYGTFLMGVFGAVADITKEGIQRNLRTTVVSAALSAALAVGTTSSGFWTRYVSYQAPIIMAASCAFLSLLFLIFAIPETNKRNGQSQLSTRRQFLGFIRIFTVESDSLTRRILILSLFIFFLANFNFQGNTSTIILYLEGSPFMWSDDKIAVFCGLSTVCSWILIVLVTKLFERCVKDVTFAFVGVFMAVAGFTVQGLAYNDAMMYTAAVIFLLSNHAIPLMRATMSRHVNASQQGALFSGVAVMEMMCGTIAGVSAPYLYKLGLRYYYGLHSLVFAGLSAICLVAVIALRFSLASDTKRRFALLCRSERVQE